MMEMGPRLSNQGGSYGGQSSYAYAQQQAARTRAQAEQRRRQQIRYEYGLATGLQSLPIIREGLNLYRNWNTSLLNTLKHVCNPKTTKASDRGVNKTLSIADFRKYEDAARHGLTVSEKANIDSGSLSDLKNKYGNVLGNYSTYQGTGYFNPLGSAKNRYIISRYNELKAIEDVKVAQKVAERNKYHYTNLYKHIAETGNRIDGTPASDLEKAVAPYVPWIAPIQDVAAAVAGRQVAKYNSSVPTGNGMKWGAEKSTKAVDKASDVAKNAGKSINPKSIKASDLSMTETVKNHANDVIKRGKYVGEKARPYVNNAGTDLIIQEIIDGGSPVKDKFLPNGWRWEVNGTFNGRQEGIWELIVDLDTNQIVHFNYVR